MVAINFYFTFVAMCNGIGKKPSKVAQEIGISKSVVTRWKNGGHPTDANLQKIADFFHVPLYSLENETYNKCGLCSCPICGFNYPCDDENAVQTHELQHSKNRVAVNKYGFIWLYSYREAIKASVYEKMGMPGTTDDEYVSCYIDLFKAYFSRSLEGYNYDLSHPDFPTYVSMLLYQEHWKNQIPQNVYKTLVKKYGANPGLSEGTTYYLQIKPSGLPHNQTSANESLGKQACDAFEKALLAITGNLSSNQKRLLLSLVKAIVQDQAFSEFV